MSVTGAQAGLTGDDQIKIALSTIIAAGGMATMQQIYQAVESELKGRHLSEQGRASLRRLVNTFATNAGYDYKHDPANPGWRITPEGRELIAEPPPPTQEVFNVDTQQPEQIPNTARGAAFELYVLGFLRTVHPYHTWYHQGRRKAAERGLDFIGDLIGNRSNELRTIGAQAKFHLANTAPAQIEWLKFLAGCFARRIDGAMFITSGRLTAEQRREAGEARVVVVEGRSEIERLANLYRVPPFELFEPDDEVLE